MFAFLFLVVELFIYLFILFGTSKHLGDFEIPETFKQHFHYSNFQKMELL